MKRKITSALISLVLVVGLFPNMAFASDLKPVSLATEATASPVKAIAAGPFNSAVILEDGTLWMWGQNEYGKLGDGSTENRAAAVKIMDNVASVSLGDNHSAAVTATGDLYTWGRNNYFQLGDGTTTDRTSPVKVMSGVKSVSCGSSNTAVVKTDGTLWAWGYNAFGDLGDGTITNRTSPTKIMTGVSSVVMNGSCGAAVKTDGTLWTWGRNFKGSLGNGSTASANCTSPTQIMSSVASVDLCGFHGAAVKTNGTLWTWGWNDYGQLGNGTTTSSGAPAQVATGVSRVDLGMYFTTAVKTTGAALTWGSYTDGALGTGASANVTSPPASAVLTGVSATSAGYGHVLALKADGTLWVWGRGDYGQLGNGTTSGSATPVQWALDPTIDISGATINVLSTPTYTGKALKPEVSVKCGSKTLVWGTDYRIKYTSNVNAGTATVLIAGMGLYRGDASGSFTIARAQIGSASIALPSSVAFSGVAATPKPTITFNGATLSEGSDYSLAYSNNASAGTGKVTITGAGNFQGSVTKAFTITGGSNAPAPTLCYGVDNARLKLADITPAEDFDIGVSDDGTAIICGCWSSSSKIVVPNYIDGHKVVGFDQMAFRHYEQATEIYLPDTVTMGDARAFEGCTSLKYLNLGSLQKSLDRNLDGMLDGCKSLQRLTMSDKANFTITAQNVADGNFDIMGNGGFNSLRYVYIGKSMKGMPISFLYGKSLQRVDVAAGNAQYSSSGGAVYSANGKTLLIVPAAYTGSYTVKAGCTAIGKYGLDGCSKLTKLVVPETVRSIGVGAFNGMSATIVTPKGSYASYYARNLGRKVSHSGVASKPYKVSIAGAKISGLGAKTYNGRAQKPAPVVTLGGKKLKSGSDYAVSYKGNVNAGTASVVVTGKGDYAGSKSATFKIGKAANTIVAKGKTATVKYKSLKKKAQTIAASKAIAVSKAVGKTAFKKASGSKGISISKTGQVTVKKGCKKGTYAVKAKVSAAGNANYAAKTVTVAFKVSVK